jgi:hypothetical protein
MTLEAAVLTDRFAAAMAEAEKLIVEAAHIQTDQDLLEGLEYLAGGIRASMQFAFAYERDFPYFSQSTGPYMKMGLDNPDTLYYSADIRDNAEYVVTGTRGSAADLNFQVMAGHHAPNTVPDSPPAFDDRAIEIGADGTYEVRFGPAKPDVGPNYVTLPAGMTTLVVREVFSDWATEQPGRIRIQRADRTGLAPTPKSTAQLEKAFEVAATMLINRIKTFLVFPEMFYLSRPANTMWEPRLTPGGLTSQFSSAGHYELDDNQALIVTVPASDAPYQGMQLGSMWYVSLDYINHQTSLTTSQARVDPDGKIRFVVAERNPGLVNWLECTGHRKGYLQIRWQRLSRELTVQDGPGVELVSFNELPERLPYYAEAQLSPREWSQRIAIRQVAVANRMLS